MKFCCSKTTKFHDDGSLISPAPTPGLSRRKTVLTDGRSLETCTPRVSRARARRQYGMGTFVSSCVLTFLPGASETNSYGTNWATTGSRCAVFIVPSRYLSVRYEIAFQSKELKLPSSRKSQCVNCLVFHTFYFTEEATILKVFLSNRGPPTRCRTPPPPRQDKLRTTLTDNPDVWRSNT